MKIMINLNNHNNYNNKNNKYNKLIKYESNYYILNIYLYNYY